MSTAVQRRRGTTAQHAAFIGLVGETTFDTTLNRPVVHDGVLAGGYPAAMLHLAQTFAQTQTFAAATNFLGSTATNDNALKFVNPPGVGTSTFDFNTNGTPDLNFFRKYNTTPFQIEMAASGGMDFVIDSNNNETGATVRFLTNAIRGGVQTLLFTVFDNTNATLVGNFTANKLLLPNTTSATVGGIYFGGNRALHNFGTNNFFAGVNSGNFTLSGDNNTGVGASSLQALTTGFSNLAIGRSALFSNTIGTINIAIGFQALFSNVSASGNTAIGVNALLVNTAGNNTAIGTSSLISNTTGVNNLGIGLNTLFSNITGNNNTALGHQALFSSTGSGNAGIGANALFLTTGSNNTGIGFQAGDNLTTGSNNIVLGYDIDSPTATNSNTLTIGNLIFGTGVDGTGTTISSGNVGIAVITPTSGLHLGRSFATPYREIAATDTFAATDYTINTTAGTFTLNLPTAVGITGRIYVAKNSGAGVVTLDGSGGELIDGLATQAIAAGASLTVQSTGAGWIII